MPHSGCCSAALGYSFLDHASVANIQFCIGHADIVVVRPAAPTSAPFSGRVVVLIVVVVIVVGGGGGGGGQEGVEDNDGKDAPPPP
jgi:hypothetical protein